MLATVTANGRLTLPKAIREGLGIGPGSKLDFEPLPDGSLRVRVLQSGSASLFGLLHNPARDALAVAAMDDGIGAAVRARQYSK